MIIRQPRNPPSIIYIVEMKCVAIDESQLRETDTKCFALFHLAVAVGLGLACRAIVG